MLQDANSTFMITRARACVCCVCVCVCVCMCVFVPDSLDNCSEKQGKLIPSGSTTSQTPNSPFDIHTCKITEARQHTLVLYQYNEGAEAGAQ